MDTDFEKIGRILVRGVNWVGDTVMTYPAVERLKGRFPRSHLAILVRENLVDLWKTVPYVDEVIPFQQKRGWNGVWGDLRLSLLLKKKGFDLVKQKLHRTTNYRLVASNLITETTVITKEEE